MGISQLVKLKKSKRVAWKIIAILLPLVLLACWFLFNYESDQRSPKSILPGRIQDILDNISLSMADHAYFFATFQLPSLADKWQCVYFHTGNAVARYKANLCPINFGMIPKGSSFSGPDWVGCRLYYEGLIIQRSTAVDIARANFLPNDIRLAQALDATACMRMNDEFPEDCSESEAKQAIKEYNEAREVWAATGNWQKFYATSYNLAFVCVWCNDFDHAMRVISEGLHAPGKISNNLKLKLLNLRAHCYCGKHDYKAMQIAWGEIISTAQQTHDQKTIDNVNWLSIDLGLRCMAYQAWDEAIAILSKELRANWATRERLLPILAECYCRKGEYTKALPFYRELIKEYEQHNAYSSLSTDWDLIEPLKQYSIILHKLPDHDNEIKEVDKRISVISHDPLWGSPPNEIDRIAPDMWKMWRSENHLDSPQDAQKFTLPHLHVPTVEAPDDAEVAQDLQ